MLILGFCSSPTPIIDKTAGETDKATSLLCEVLRWAGVTINVAKSKLVPNRVLDYIGIVFDLDAWTISVRQKTIDKLVKLCGVTIVSKRIWSGPVLVRHLQVLVGCCNFAEVVITGLRPLKLFFIGLMRQAEKREIVVLSKQSLFYLKSIVLLASYNNAKTISTFESLTFHQHSHFMSTDASETGYGGFGVDAAGKTFYFHGVWADLEGFPVTMSIADLELWTHFMLLDLLLEHIVPGESAVCVRIDNMNALSWVNNLRCRVDVDIDNHLDRLEWICNYQLLNEKKGLEVRTEYVQSDLNVEADALSRPGSKLTAYLASLPAGSRMLEWYWRPTP